MTWISSGSLASPNWVLSGTAMSVRSSLSTDSIRSLRWSSTSKTFHSDKMYQVQTYVKSFYTPSTSDFASFSVTAPSGGEKIMYVPSEGLPPIVRNMVPPSPGNGYLYFYTTPITNITTTDYVKYEANSYFGTFSTPPSEGIYGMNMNELKWSIQGFSWFRLNPLVTSNSATGDALGWHYDSVNNTFLWLDHPTNIKYPTGGPYGQKISHSGYRANNYISRLVNYSFFNISFSYQKVNGNPNDVLKIYTSPASANTWGTGTGSQTLPFGTTLIATMSMSGSTYSAFYGLPGNQYVYIVGPTTSNASGVYFAVSNLKIEGGYHSGNNLQYLMTNSGSYSNPTTLYPIGLTGATYTAYSGYGNTVNATNSLTIYAVNALLGNGTFKAGIWENGVWNSGWRYDENLHEFYSIGQYFEFNRSKEWRFILTGPESSVSNFNIGDKVSIGNIVAIDINEDRKLIKSYFSIVNKTSTSIIVELTNNFPLRRIEIDSPNHRIYVTKNIWLSGGFLNGYFRGVWNYGLFKGYPKITEMYDTHWIDGIFEGGHYHADQLGSYFTDTVYTDPTGASGEAPKLGLTFSSPHKLNVGDLIKISKDNTSINPQYNGYAKVTSVPNEYQIVTDKDWGSDSTSESGWVYTHISSGVIQNFIFDSGNVSKITSVQSLDSASVFTYNSWIDVSYSPHTAVSIGKPQFQMDSNTNKPFSENNLFGYPTYDILSSTSKFRDSYSLQYRTYKLGTKYKIYNDFIGDSSKFEDPLGYGTPDTNAKWPSILVDDQLLIEQGWTYSKLSGFTLSRTVDSGIDPIVGEELKVESLGAGGVLDFDNIGVGIVNRTVGDVEKYRYSMVEFDLVTYSVVSFTYSEKSSMGKGAPNLSQPTIHLNNLNYIYRDAVYSNGTFSTILNASYLPVYQNVNHLTTEYEGNSIKKYEYFYNKRNLAMYFRGSGLLGTEQSAVIIDNLKFYELDMIPFFKYFEEENINVGVQVPYQGIAPFIDYTNSNFSFIDNISIGLGSIQTAQSFVPFSGVGIGIGSGIGGSTPIFEQAAIESFFNP